MSAEAHLGVIQGFPAGLRARVHECTASLDARPQYPGQIREIIVDGEQLRMPQRLFATEPDPTTAPPVDGVSSAIQACILSCHHDGYVRERACRRLLNEEPRSFAVPYVLELASAYVIEIAELIARHRHRWLLATGPAVIFAAENPAYLMLLRERATSYWDCYYRARYSKHDYPGHLVIEDLLRAASTTVP